MVLHFDWSNAFFPLSILLVAFETASYSGVKTNFIKPFSKVLSGRCDVKAPF